MAMKFLTAAVIVFLVATFAFGQTYTLNDEYCDCEAMAAGYYDTAGGTGYQSAYESRFGSNGNGWGDSSSGTEKFYSSVWASPTNSNTAGGSVLTDNYIDPSGSGSNSVTFKIDFKAYDVDDLDFGGSYYCDGEQWWDNSGVSWLVVGNGAGTVQLIVTKYDDGSNAGTSTVNCDSNGDATFSWTVTDSHGAGEIYTHSDVFIYVEDTKNKCEATGTVTY